MNAIDVLRSRIPVFPGYFDEDARRLSDKLVRSYLGEALALLQERLAPDDESLRGRLADLIFRAEFTNQRAFKVFEYAALDQVRVDMISESDLAMIEDAERASGVTAATLSTYLQDVRATFDARDLAMENTAAA